MKGGKKEGKNGEGRREFFGRSFSMENVCDIKETWIHFVIILMITIFTIIIITMII